MRFDLQAINKLKEDLANPPTLQIFDLVKRIVLSDDSSTMDLVKLAFRAMSW